MPLDPGMSLEEFDNGYWYATELKAFAKRLEVPGAQRLRKDELELVIRQRLRDGKGPKIKPEGPTKAKGAPDSERPLTRRRRIVNYVNDRPTKEFLLLEAKKADPEFKLQSGTRYRLNRWREERISEGTKLSYGALVDHFVDLNRGKRIPLRTSHGRFNNFVADFSAAFPSTPRSELLAAWAELKSMDIPKTFAAWKSAKP